MATNSAPHKVSNVMKLTSCAHGNLCHGYRWEIQDEDALAKIVAWTFAGEHRHACFILTQLQPSLPVLSVTAKKQAIKELTLPPKTSKDSPLRSHRDGKVFQHIAWIAALIEGQQDVVISAPHMRRAEKGFDALIFPLKGIGDPAFGLIICEEKATTNPRSQFQAEVVPGIKNLETGCRDAELKAELTTLLERSRRADVDDIIIATHWLNNKHYRISITIDVYHEANRADLFKDYDDAVGGAVKRRRAETIYLPKLRDWMDAFCLKVISKL